MKKVGRPKGSTKEDNKVICGPFRLNRMIAKWLKKQPNQTRVVEDALAKEMKKKWKI